MNRGYTHSETMQITIKIKIKFNDSKTVKKKVNSPVKVNLRHAPPMLVKASARESKVTQSNFALSDIQSKNNLNNISKSSFGIDSGSTSRDTLSSSMASMINEQHSEQHLSPLAKSQMSLKSFDPLASHEALKSTIELPSQKAKPKRKTTLNQSSTKDNARLLPLNEVDIAEQYKLEEYIHFSKLDTIHLPLLSKCDNLRHLTLSKLEPIDSITKFPVLSLPRIRLESFQVSGTEWMTINDIMLFLNESKNTLEHLVVCDVKDAFRLFSLPSYSIKNFTNLKTLIIDFDVTHANMHELRYYLRVALNPTIQSLEVLVEKEDETVLKTMKSWQFKFPIYVVNQGITEAIEPAQELEKKDGKRSFANEGLFALAYFIDSKKDK